MSLCIESGYTSLNKENEELCGDKVEIAYNENYVTCVLADGMGSGVKANILATLSSKILCTMIKNDLPIEDCIETLIESLPVCKVRGVAYSTFSILHMDTSGQGYLYEFDNPEAILIRDGVCGDLDREKLTVLGKTVYRTCLTLKAGDVIVMMSDGTIHAGIGKVLNFGWERGKIMEYLTKKYKPDMSARCVACILASACNDLYLDKPGDDTTVCAVKIREQYNVNLMVGPPIDKEKDDYYISQFLAGDSAKIVCGGTSSQIVAKHLGAELKTSFDFPDKDIPPIGFIDGIDLTTEGFITLRRVLELSEKYLSISDLTPKNFTKKDGASLVADYLFEKATNVNFFVGQSVNKAHTGMPIDTTLKLKLIEKLSANLKHMGKKVTIQYD